MSNIILGNKGTPTAFYVGNTGMQRVYLGDENLWANFVPTQVSGLEIWLDASEGTNMYKSETNKVAIWQDKVNGYAFSNLDAGEQPTFETNVQNGYGALKFDGGDYLHWNDVVTQDDTASYFIVAKTTTTGNQAIYYATGGKILFIGAGVGSGNNSFTALFGDGSSWNTSSTALSPNRSLGNDFHVLGITNTGADSTAGCQPTHDGEEYTTVNGDHINFSSVNIGAYPDGSVGWTGYICEILVYNTNVSSTNRKKIEGWLAWKWGINDNLDASHPNVSDRPVI